MRWSAIPVVGFAKGSALAPVEGWMSRHCPRWEASATRASQASLYVSEGAATSYLCALFVCLCGSMPSCPRSSLSTGGFFPDGIGYASSVRPASRLDMTIVRALPRLEQG